jgi:hypothetical protein
MNDYDIEHHGKIYRYDPDQDIFYCEQPSSLWDRYGWLGVITVLAAIALYFEFYPLR